MKKLCRVAFACVIGVIGCGENKSANEPIAGVDSAKTSPLTRLKNEAAPGDLIVRLGDDLLSYQIKFLNEKDQSYSHAGLIVQQNGQKMVAHISPEEKDRDSVQYISIDSFLNPAKNLTGALFRYQLTTAQKNSLVKIIDNYRMGRIRFDRVYDLTTDDRLYCSEMIAKAVKQASGGTIDFRFVNVPEKLQPALFRHFNQELSKQTIAERKIMTIDNLYRVPQCTQILQVTLKTLPGQ